MTTRQIYTLIFAALSAFWLAVAVLVWWVA